MTDQREQATGSPAAGVDVPVVSHSGLTRREMLRGAATAAVPTILTLGSGAALAASSNLLGTVQTPPPGDVNCLDPKSTQGTLPTNPNVYDLGSPPYAEVKVIESRHRYRNPSSPSRDMTPADVCRFNGTVEVQYNYSGKWQAKSVKPGAMVSAAALASFGSRINKTYI